MSDFERQEPSIFMIPSSLSQFANRRASTRLASPQDGTGARSVPSQAQSPLDAAAPSHDAGHAQPAPEAACASDDLPDADVPVGGTPAGDDPSQEGSAQAMAAPAPEAAGVRRPARIPSVTEELAVILMEKPIRDEDREAAAGLVLDAMANALGARLTTPGRIVREWWQRLGVVGRPSDPGREAFLLGALTHSLETDDLHRASVVHPGCVVVPAAWTAARAMHLDGKGFLDAVIRGFEAATRIGSAVGPAHYKTWHNTATCGPFGAAAAVASILDLDRDKLVHALGNAGTQSSGLWEFLDSGAMSKHLHAGRAAEAGWMAATLAQGGFTGPRTILEGRRGLFAAMCPDGAEGLVTAEPDALWQVHATSIKPWPCCRHTHPAIDGALSLREELEARGTKVHDISGIHVRTYQAAIDVTDRMDPQTEYEAKFSMQHCVAAALSPAPMDFTAFGDAARANLAALRARISLVLEPRFDDAYPRAWGSAVCITLRDGTRLEAVRDHARGDPEAPLSRSDLEAKAHMLLNHGHIPHADMWVELFLGVERAPALPDVAGYLEG